MERVVLLSAAMGRELGFTAEQARRLELAARLRDIGLCSVPYRLVNEMPMSDWNVIEREDYFRHAEVGATMLQSIPELCTIAPIVRHHHSRFDGKDSPFLPCGTSLPVEARILHVACDYVWHERSSGQQIARRILIDGGGVAYCPDALNALLCVIPSNHADVQTLALA